MIPGIGTLAPLFLGPIAGFLGVLLVIVLIALVVRVVFSLAWRLVVIGAVVLGVLWLLNALGSGPPAFV